MPHFFCLKINVYYKLFALIYLYFITGDVRVYIRLYADSMAAVNMAVIYILLSLADLINRRNSSVKKRLLISAVFSLSYTLLAIADFSLFLNSGYIFVILLAMAYSLPCGIFELLRDYVIINILSCVIYGFAEYLFKVFGVVNISITIVGAIITYISVRLMLFYISNKKYYNISIYNNNSSVKLKALMDTGNLLTDNITGKPVIIAESKCINSIIGGSVLRKLYYKSLGSSNSCFYVFNADRAVVNGHIIYSPVIAIYESKLSDDGKYNAIIGLKHLGGR